MKEAKAVSHTRSSRTRIEKEEGAREDHPQR